MNETTSSENTYNNPSGYIPGEFSESRFVFTEYNMSENHIVVPPDETDENFQG